MTEKPPNPGSPEAMKQGCKCPVLDNEHGRGTHTDETGKTWFIFSLSCPLHGRGDWQDDD